MCGRINVIEDPLCRLVSEQLGIQFSAPTNSNLCPGQSVSTIVGDGASYRQINLNWGIKPNWSRRLIINAQSETVAQKPTFRQAFKSHRCLIPCSGWYEWREEAGKKVKYLFSQTECKPLYMAGIWFEAETPQLVTLTTSPNKKCAEYHKRMPALVLPENIDYWFQSPPDQLGPVLMPVSPDLISVNAVS